MVRVSAGALQGKRHRCLQGRFRYRYNGVNQCQVTPIPGLQGRLDGLLLYWWSSMA